MPWKRFPTDKLLISRPRAWTDPMPAAEAELQRLPRGRHGLPSEFIAENQRRRLLAAVPVACAAKGYAKTAVTDIVEGAQVSRKTFYERFTDKEKCALAAFEVFAGELVEAVEGACKTRAAWPDRVGAGIAAGIEYLADDPPVAHFLSTGVVAVGPKGVAAQHALFERLARGLAPGRTASPRAAWMSPESEWGLVAYLSMLVARRVTGEADRLTELTPELIQAALTPYVGPEEAHETAERSRLSRPNLP